MKDSTKETSITFALVIAVGFMCGIFGFVAGLEKGKNESVERLLSIEKRLDSHHRIHLALVAHLNTFYEYVDVEWEIGSVEQDTIEWETIYGERSESTLDHSPIPPPAGLEAIIKRSVYQNLKKPRVVDTVRWEKTEE